MPVGLYLCVKAYGQEQLSFNLRATLTQCPADFSNTGERMECSSVLSSPDKRHSGCTAEGICLCKPPYEKPPMETYEGLSHSRDSLTPFLPNVINCPILGCTALESMVPMMLEACCMLMTPSSSVLTNTLAVPPVRLLYISRGALRETRVLHLNQGSFLQYLGFLQR